MILASSNIVIPAASAFDLRFYHREGITVERVLTDNSPAYIATAHAIACRAPLKS